MQTKVYVDVLLVLNYIINMLLILCTAKLTGRRPERRRIVAAALFGSASALTIFLPFLGFVVAILLRLALASGIILIAFKWDGARAFGIQLFVFFAASFFFSGVMLAIWMAFAPHGMIYYNGVVYFEISSVTLVLTTVVAYLALTALNRFARRGRVRTAVYRAEIRYRGGSVQVGGLVDTGNSLYEPFSDIPVMVCQLDDIAPLLPEAAVQAIRGGEHLDGKLLEYGIAARMVPFATTAGAGMIPAFRPDAVCLEGAGGRYRVESVYIAVTTRKIGGMGYSALLNPDLIGIRV